MTEQSKAATARIGTVAEEAARLIEDVATMARSSSGRSEDPSPYAGRPAQEPASPDAPPASRPEDAAASAGAPADPPSAGACTSCGGERGSTPIACKLCPLCQGIALLRSVRPETVDRLADLASAVAECLRDMAAQTRKSGQTPSTAGPASRRPSDRGRSTQDIPVDDQSEG
jgi:hypothetical protein